MKAGNTKQLIQALCKAGTGGVRQSHKLTHALQGFDSKPSSSLTCWHRWLERPTAIFAPPWANTCGIKRPSRMRRRCLHMIHTKHCQSKQDGVSLRENKVTSWQHQQWNLFLRGQNTLRVGMHSSSNRTACTGAAASVSNRPIVAACTGAVASMANGPSVAAWAAAATRHEQGKPALGRNTPFAG